MRRLVIVAALAAIVLALLLVFGAMRAGCGIEREWQQAGDAALLCPGVDPVRLWPWPVTMPYWEQPAWLQGTEQGI